jgi:hypothetical protein
MADIPTIAGSFPAAPASADAPTVLLWVVTVLVVLLAVACLLLWQQIKDSRATCAKENEIARKEAADARAEAKRDADLARDKIEELYQQAVEQMATRETKLIQVVESNTQVLTDIREIGSGYYRTLREQRESGSHAPERRHPPHSPA